MFPFVSVPHQNHCLLYSQLCASISSFTLSIHFFGCLPWFCSNLRRPIITQINYSKKHKSEIYLLVMLYYRFLFPLIQQCNAFAGSCSLPILDTCLNEFSLCSAILSTSVVSWHRIPCTVSFLTLSRLVNAEWHQSATVTNNLCNVYSSYFNIQQLSHCHFDNCCCPLQNGFRLATRHCHSEKMSQVSQQLY